MLERISLTDMQAGETGRVVDVSGGWGLNNRLQALGIRPGINVTKITAAFARGPVVLQVAGSQTALGFGMSCKVIVEVER